MVLRLEIAYTHACNTKRRRALARLKRVWYIASRPVSSDTPPDRNYLAFAPKDVTSIPPYSRGSQTSLSMQPTPLRESLSRSNQRGSETSQVSYGRPKCDLNLVRLFCLSLLCSFSGAFSSSLPHAAINRQPRSQTVLYQTAGQTAWSCARRYYSRS